VELVKGSLSGTSANIRTILFENQGRTVYDIYLVRYSLQLLSLLDVNDVIDMALSTRAEDQVEDTTNVTFAELIGDRNIFLPFFYMADFVTEGASTIIASEVIPFTKPFSVPYLAFVGLLSVPVTANAGVEIYYERRRASIREKAQMVAEAGGRARTS